MSLRVKCNRCHKPAIIRDSAEESPDFKTLYCLCNNPKCGHTFAMHLSFSHTLSPSALDFTPEMIEKIRNLSRQQQKDLFSSLT